MDILVVEDSKTQQTLLVRALTARGHQVRAADDGPAALKLLAERESEAVVSDVLMPGMNGFELCRTIKADPRWKRIPVLLLTVLSDPNDIIQALMAGADSFVTKPFRISFLLEQLDMARHNLAMQSAGEVGFHYRGDTYASEADPHVAISLLLASYQNALQKSRELEETNAQLLRARSELENRNAELERLNREKTHFIGMAAHDLRSPLMVIQGFSTILREEGDRLEPEQRIGFLERIERSSGVMVGLINDLLDISAIESGQLRLEKTRASLEQIAREALQLNQMRADRKNIQIVLNFPPQLPQILGDVRKLEQALDNLLSNAIKYSTPGATVNLGAREEAGRVLLEVADQGSGIPAEELDRLFKPFGRTSARATGGEKSVGLGLVIVKRILDGHDATISVQSDVGRGSRFLVSFPLPDA